MVDLLRSLPGVGVDPAVGRGTEQRGRWIEGRPLVEGEVPPLVAVRGVSPGYFDAMRIALVEGRMFARLDEERDVPVVIVSRSLAQ